MQVKTKNMMFAALIVLMVGALWYRVVYSPMESKASKAKSAAHDANLSADNLRSAISGTSNTKKKAKNHDVATDVMLGAIPVATEEASFLRSIDALRISSGADWQQITPTAPTVVGSVATINVGITVQGTEDQIARYSAGLAALKRVFLVDNITITGGKNTSPSGNLILPPAGAVFSASSNGTLQLQISGRIFSQPSAVAAPVGSTVGGTATTPATSAPVQSGQTSPSGVQSN